VLSDAEEVGAMTGWAVPGYTELKELGKGGAGRVVLARHDLTGVNVAIKYVAEDLLRETSFMGDFRSEAEVLAAVESPHITRLYEYLESGEHAAIVMELVDGISLRALIREQGPLEPESALTVLKGSLQGLATAHRRRIVHRDFKPANVLVDTDGHSKLADFGLATRTGRVGVLAGTPSYMAPEQWAGAPAAPQTDIYAATATFFECLTGGPPFRVQGIPDVLRLQHEGPDVPVERAPQPVRGLLRWGLAPDPKTRPRDAMEFLRELEKVAGAAYGPDWERRGWQKLARRVALLALLLPNPPVRPPTTVSFAWTRLGRPAMALVAMVVLAGFILAGTVALADSGGSGGSGGAPVDAAVFLPPTVVGGSPAAAPTPSLSPSASPTPSPTPSATPTHPKPGKTTKPSTPSPSPSTSAPTPTIGALVIQSDVVSGSCTGGTCTLIEWAATIRASGSGSAALHVRLYPVSAAGVRSAKPSAGWDIPFDVTDPSMTWPESSDRSAEIYAACQQQYQVAVEATVTVGTSVVKSAAAKPVDCPQVIG
jgi:eukaryotic-like serine/threonine-protein kinase